jgi:serine/threonine-protein kinase HipA
MPDVSVLEVLLHGKEIGTLAQIGGDRSLFAFNDTYINNPQRPTLSLSFKDEFGELITDIKPTQTRVAPFFANLLPEGPLRTYLAQRAGVSEVRDFYLLWVLGQDLPGAVTIKPADGEAWPPDHNRTANVRRGDALRFSLAGVQLKFSAVMEASGGLTIPAEGIGGSWIIKLPSTSFQGVPENEFAMMTLARHVGINVPDFHLRSHGEIDRLPEGIGRLAGSAFIVKRFDRTDEGPVHIEDFAQVFGEYPDRKYERGNYRSIARVIWAETGEPGITEYVRRLIFNALIGNADMHMKNWTLIYPDKRNPQLAPAYDLVSTITFLPDENMALNLGRSKRWADLSIDELSYFAAKARLPEKIILDTARTTVQTFHEIWNKEKSSLLSSDSVQIIDKHIRSIPLVKECA